MATTLPRETFGRKLQGVLAERKMGANTLARLISRKYGGKVEDRRRTIIRWLRGATPLERNRHLVEDVLGVPRDSLKGEDDDEESDPDESELVVSELVDVLIDALQAFKSREDARL